MKICDICKENVEELTDIYLISNNCNRQDCCIKCFEKFKHLDAVIRQIDSQSDPIYQMARELWIAVNDAVNNTD